MGSVTKRAPSLEQAVQARAAGGGVGIRGRGRGRRRGRSRARNHWHWSGRCAPNTRSALSSAWGMQADCELSACMFVDALPFGVVWPVFGVACSHTEVVERPDSRSDSITPGGFSVLIQSSFWCKDEDGGFLRDQPGPDAFGAATPQAAFGHPLSCSTARDEADSQMAARRDMHGSFEMLDAHAGAPAQGTAFPSCMNAMYAVHMPRPG